MIVTTRLIPYGFSACALWPFIFVLPEERCNIPLIEHEMVHYREQAWVMPLWVFLYLMSKRFRLAAEARAYRRQIELRGISGAEAAQSLLGYRLGITLDEVSTALTLAAAHYGPANKRSKG